MKKFLTAMSIVLGLGLATAQQTVPATKNTARQVAPTVKSTTPKATKAATPKATKAVTPAAQPEAAKSGVKLKKDGTPDKRYKDAQHLKKDGTPDKRYKANK